MAQKTTETSRGAKRMYAVRHTNFLLLLRRFEDERPGRGVVRRFSEFVDIPENYISQVKGKHRNIGDEHAQAMEKAFGLSPGWLDIVHSARPSSTDEQMYVRQALMLFHANPEFAQRWMADGMEELFRIFKKVEKTK